MAEIEFDVVVVGYGPVGAFTALLLAKAGLRVGILERSRKPVILPRAVGLDGESVRAFQRIGLGNEVAAILQPAREKDEVCFTNSRREPLFSMQMPPRGHNGWRDVAFFDQPELEALLREFVAATDGIEVFLGKEVVGLDQGPGSAVVHTTDPDSGDDLDVRASFVIGCDGASSFVRGAVGIEWTSLGYDQDWLVVDVIQNEKADLPLATMQVCDPARLTTYVCVKDPNRRWEFQLLESESADDVLRPEKIAELLRPWAPPEHYTLRRKAVYQFHAATAESWREGRVLLAGDAAHQTPPFLGQGLNAGFRDAVNLGWKIPLVLSGLCDDSLLDTYAEERDAHARDLVDWAVAIGKLMETLAAREAGLPDPHEPDESAGYGQGRTAPPLRGGILMETQNDDDHSVGLLLRQPDLRESAPGGSAALLDDWIGSSFAVIARKDSDLRMGPEAAAVLERLGGQTLSLENFEVTQGELDSLFNTYPAVVLRPDRYIFGVVDEERDLDELLLGLESRLQLRPADASASDQSN